METLNLEGIRVFATCPPSGSVPRDDYSDRVASVARWSEEAGCCGILVYTDNGLVDPWLVAQLVIESTERLSPLVAVQPVYLHPYATAKMVASLGHLHGRRLFLNLVAGGFKNDLLALGDGTPHDERYDRTVEYGSIVQRLLASPSPSPVTFEGKHYRVHNLRMTPPVPPELRPGLLISGSSPAGLDAARALGATAVRYPKPPGEEDEVPSGGSVDFGVRVGIVARERAEEAWAVARLRFPEDRKGQITHKLAVGVSDSQWHRQLSEREAGVDSNGSPYWLGPFQNYKTFCPYLVGSYERVALEVAGYLALGYRTFILDVPTSPEDLLHTAVVFGRALTQTPA